MPRYSFEEIAPPKTKMHVQNIQLLDSLLFSKIMSGLEVLVKYFLIAFLIG